MAARVTQVAVEVFAAGGAPKARVTQVAVEVFQPLTIVDLTITGSAGIASAEAFGADGITNVLKGITGLFGITSAEAFGVDGIIYESLLDGRSSAGITSEEAFGAGGSVTGPITGVTGITSAEAFGLDGVIGGMILDGRSSAGITSEEAFGAGGTIVGPIIGSVGITSSEAFGVGGAVSGPLTGSAGIASAEAFGAGGSVTGPITGVTGITSAEAFGVGGTVAVIVGIKGIPSVETFGSGGGLLIGLYGLAPGINSEEAFGGTGTLFIAGQYDDNFSLHIGGVDMSQYLRTDPSTFSIRQQLNMSAAATLEIYVSDGSYIPVVGQEVLLHYYHGSEWYRIFGGSVDSVAVEKNTASADLFIEVQCVDYAKALSRRVITKKFPANQFGTFVSIMDYISHQYLTPEGIEWVNQGDPGVAIGDIQFSYHRLNEVLDQLGELVNWNYTIDFFRRLFFYSTPNIVTAAPWDLDETSENYASMRVTSERGLYANRIILKVSQTSPSIVHGPPDGTVTERYYVGLDEPSPPAEFQRYFKTGDYLVDLTYWKRVAAIRSIKLNGVTDLVFYTEGDPANPPPADWDYAQIWNNELNLIWNELGKPGAHPTAGDYIDITMDVWDTSAVAAAPLEGQIENAAEIAARAAIEGGTGIYTMVVDVQDITDPDVLTEYAQALLDRFSVMGLELEFETTSFGLEPGQLINAVLPSYGLSSQAAVIESIDLTEQGKKLLRQRVRASNEIQQRDSLTAFQRLIRRIRKGSQETHQETTFILAQDLNPLQNPGLVTGTNVTNAKVVQQDFQVAYISCYFKDGAVGADIELDIKADGVSIMDGDKIVYPAGTSSTEIRYTNFADPPLTLVAGTVLTIDVLQTGTTTPGKNGTITIAGS